MRRGLANKKYFRWIVLVIILAIAVFGAAAVIIARSKALASTEEDIFAEKNYTIISQTPCDLTLSISRSAIPDKAFTEEGYTFGENEAVAYKTDTTTIYLEHVQLANEGEEDLYFIFNCIYDLPESGSFIAAFHKIQDKGYRSDVQPKSKNIRDDVAVYEDVLSIRGHGPGQRFAFYVSTDVCRNAVGTIYMDISSCYEITYHRNK